MCHLGSRAVTAVLHVAIKTAREKYGYLVIREEGVGGRRVLSIMKQKQMERHVEFRTFRKCLSKVFMYGHNSNMIKISTAGGGAYT